MTLKQRQQQSLQCSCSVGNSSSQNKPPLTRSELPLSSPLVVLSQCDGTLCSASWCAQPHGELNSGRRDSQLQWVYKYAYITNDHPPSPLLNGLNRQQVAPGRVKSTPRPEPKRAGRVVSPNSNSFCQTHVQSTRHPESESPTPPLARTTPRPAVHDVVLQQAAGSSSSTTHKRCNTQSCNHASGVKDSKLRRAIASSAQHQFGCSCLAPVHLPLLSASSSYGIGPCFKKG
jgi:hypothetical protein